nr:MAG TPA: hypothetical protein [Caudoviricetes sp.]
MLIKCNFKLVCNFFSKILAYFKEVCNIAPSLPM